MPPAGTGASSERHAVFAVSALEMRKGAKVQQDRPHASRRNLLLAALPDRDLSLLAPHLKEVPLAQGVVLQEQGERIDQVYFPHDGIVSLLAVMQQGNAIETATIGYEGAVGALSGLGPRRSHTRAVVQVAGCGWRIAAAGHRREADGGDASSNQLRRYSGEV